nr:hypothetical protein GCM10020092_023370 [Actinoplanes digitatis]
MTGRRQMGSKVDVWLAGSTVAQLTPPPESIIDGDPAATVVRICCLRREGMSGLEVSVAVDEATADRFTRACLLETIWKQRVLSAILLVLALTVVGFVIDAVINDSELLGGCFSCWHSSWQASPSAAGSR